MTFPPAGLVLGGGAVIAMTLAGASFGSVVSLLIARDIPNHELQTFQTGVAQGQTLLILDIPTLRVDEISKLVKNTHPETQIGVAKPAKFSK